MSFTTAHQKVAEVAMWKALSAVQQPVVREPLTDAQIAEMMRDTWGCASIAPRHAMGFARAIEAEVHNQDDALIRQLVEAMEGVKALNMGGELALWTAEFDRLLSAITAARARLGEKT